MNLNLYPADLCRQTRGPDPSCFQPSDLTWHDMTVVDASALPWVLRLWGFPPHFLCTRHCQRAPNHLDGVDFGWSSYKGEKKRFNGNIFESCSKLFTNQLRTRRAYNWPVVFLWLFLGGLFQSVSKPNFEKNNKCKAGRKNRDDLAEKTVIHDVSAAWGNAASRYLKPYGLLFHTTFFRSRFASHFPLPLPK